jgi:hypothetical protein
MNHNAPDRKRKRLAEFDERLARESLDVAPGASSRHDRGLDHPAGREAGAAGPDRLGADGKPIEDWRDAPPPPSRSAGN